MKPTQRNFAVSAKHHELLIAEYEGDTFGIGTRDELDGLIRDGILPEGTTLRDAREEDF